MREAALIFIIVAGMVGGVLWDRHDLQGQIHAAEAKAGDLQRKLDAANGRIGSLEHANATCGAALDEQNRAVQRLAAEGKRLINERESARGEAEKLAKVWEQRASDTLAQRRPPTVDACAWASQLIDATLQRERVNPSPTQ